MQHDAGYDRLPLKIDSTDLASNQVDTLDNAGGNAVEDL